ncbi:MAG: DUF4266 domain-containing protein [Nevskia sp.]|nr:DUF4266 domain-containing protein [Nevskia sp.]
MRPFLTIGALCAGTLLLGACSSMGMMPKAWQRGDLARPEMAWDPDPVDAAARAHTYDSKESASGAASVGGGGCGCTN